MSGWSPPGTALSLPTGAAGGDLAGTYPSPVIAPLAVTNAKVAAAAALAISKLADPTAGKVIGSSAGAAAAVIPPGFEVGYDQITANVTISSATEATGTVIIPGSSHTFDGAAVIAEFFATEVIPGDSLTFCLFEATVEIGILAIVLTAAIRVPVYARLSFTPTAGPHTYSVTAIRGAVNGTLGAGAGGIGGLLPAFLRFTKA